MSDIALETLKISGPEAQSFLQGQLTCDMQQINAEQSHMGAYCNQQGRVIANFQIKKAAEGYLLSLPNGMLSILQTALKKYAIFSKVSFTDVTDTHPNSYNRKQAIQSGLAYIYPATSGLFLPHRLNYHVNGTISFDKGCFVGQEVIARMHYRGKLKHHLCLAEIDTPDESLTPGLALLDANQQEKVNVVDICIPSGLALVIVKEPVVQNLEELHHGKYSKIFCKNVNALPSSYKERLKPP